MALEFEDYKLGPGFNNNYSDIVNCKIVRPPYMEGEVPDTFFLTKRDGFKFKFNAPNWNDMGYDEIYDFEIYNDSWVFLIGRVGDYIHVKRYIVDTDTVQTIRSSQLWKEGVNYKFIYLNTVKGGSVLYTNNNVSADATDVALDVDVGSGKEGYYAYLFDKNTLYSDSAGYGQVMKIDYVSGGKTYVSSTGWLSKPVKVKMRVYSGFGKTLAFIDTDYIQVIHDFEDTISVPNDLLPIVGVPKPLDAIFDGGRLYVACQAEVVGQITSNVYGGGRGYFDLYFGSKSFLGSSLGVKNIISYRGYILLMHNNGIDVVNSVNIQSTSGTSTYEVIENMTNDLVMFNQNSYLTGREGFYLFTKKRKLVSVNITPEGDGKYQVNFVNEGGFIQKYLDNVDENDSFRLYSTDEGIVVLNGKKEGMGLSDRTNIFTFNNTYKGWLRSEVGVYFGNIKDDIFINNNLSFQEDDLNIDYGTPYGQHIEILAGKGGLYEYKWLFLTKIILGFECTKNLFANFLMYAGGNRYNQSINLNNADYFLKISGSSNLGSDFGDSSFMESLFYDGMINGSEKVSPVGVIEIPSQFIYLMGKISINGGDNENVHFGGFMLGFDKNSASVTETINTISY